MNRQTLKDHNHRIIGYIDERNDGVLVGKDAQHRIKGYFDPKRNQTKDARHRVVGHGNLLTNLISGV